MKKIKNTNTQNQNFETALAQLNQIVEKMEKGGLSLEDSLSQFEQGVTLIRSCQELLKQAEQKISVYNKAKNQLEDFHDPQDISGKSG